MKTSGKTKQVTVDIFVTDDKGFINCDDEDDCKDKRKKTTGKSNSLGFVYDIYHIANMYCVQVILYPFFYI